MASPSGHRPSPAKGTLRDVPVAHALVYLRNKRLSGTYEVASPDERKASVVVWRGRLAQAATSPAVARFGSVAYELGLIDAATLDDVTAASTRRRVPQADLLVDRGALTPAERVRVTGEQLRRRVLHLFTFPETSTFAFREATASAPEPPLLVDPLAPVWRGISDFPDLRRIHEALTRVGTSSLVMVSEAVLEHGALDDAERAFCEELIATPATIPELVARTALPRAVAERLVYLLLLAQCVEPVAARVSKPSGTRSAVIPEQTSRSSLSFKLPHVGATEGVRRSPKTPDQLGASGVRLRAARIGQETAHEALGVDGGASTEEIRAAYMRLAREWNPTRLAPELAAVRDEVARVHAWLGVAYRAILDAKSAHG